MDRLQRRWAIIVFLALVILAGSYYDFWRKSSGPAQNGVGGGIEIAVYISGEVNNPGVYKLKPGSRITDAVEAAGGLTADAEQKTVNLAQSVKDGMHINIPALNSGVVRLPDNETTAAANDRVNINLADKSELEGLPGIGPVIADRIISHRQAKGPFQDISDLKKVPGIGEVKFNRIKNRLII